MGISKQPPPSSSTLRCHGVPERLVPEYSDDFEILCLSSKPAPGSPPGISAVKADEKPPGTQEVVDGGLLQLTLTPHNHQMGDAAACAEH